MRWAASVLLIIAMLAALWTAFGTGEEPTFTEADAEATMRMVIDRCPGAGRGGRIECTREAGSFVCRSGRGYRATFEEPDPEHPTVSVQC